MATAKQLPSGSWFIRIYDNELKKQVCFTSKLEGKAGKNEVEMLARQYLLGAKEKKLRGKTFSEAATEYIDLKENILSPKTIAEYRRIYKNYLAADLGKMYLSEISNQTIQNFVNMLALSKSPRTVKNVYSLISGVLNIYVPDLRLKVSRPRINNEIKQLPNVQDVLAAVVGSDIELPCMLAIWCGMRLSEILGAKKADIHDNILTIHQTKVHINGEDILKDTTKTIESTRQIKLPAYIVKLIEDIKDDSEFIVSMTGHVIYNHFSKLLKQKELPHISFHDLRHLNASVMLALGIPDKYAMERGGWSSTSVLKSVYQHTFSTERQAADAKVDNFFNNVLAINLVTDNDK